jgi:predicted TIM-barrel fold metal-dependent hydrolase
LDYQTISNSVRYGPIIKNREQEMIIDVHMHYGDSQIFQEKVTESILIDTMDKNGVQASVVQPFADQEFPAEVHDEIADLAKKYTGRIFGMASVSPLVDEDKYFREAERCIRTLGFVGIKLHPFMHRTPPHSPVADKAFRAAAELKVPLMIHTGVGVPFSLPSLCIPRARQFPDLRIVIAHCGKIMLFYESLVLAQECPNVYFDTSWVRITDNLTLIKQATADRVMFGSDVPQNQAFEIAKYNLLDISKEDREKCLGETAKQVYRL